MDIDVDGVGLKRSLILASLPLPSLRKSRTIPYHLYNRMFLLEDYIIAVLSHLVAGNMMFNAEAQAIWTAALFDGGLTLPSVHNRQRNVATWVAYCKRLYS